MWPWVYACREGSDEVVEQLLTNGANIYQCVEKGWSPLYLACYDKHESSVWILVENKADVNLSDAQGFNPVIELVKKDTFILFNIYCAIALILINLIKIETVPTVEDGKFIIVNLLLQINANINLCNKEEGTLRFTACSTLIAHPHYYQSM